MHKIAVLSDTHGLLRPEILEILRGCEVILHGGDINDRKILDELDRIAPVSAVRGNNDKEWAKDLPKTRTFRLYGLCFFMVHNKKQIPKEIDADVIIYGHSHKYEERHEGKKLFLNPGSCGPRRFAQPITMAVLEVEERADGAVSCRVKRIEIARMASGVSEKGYAEQGKLPENMKQTIASVMRDTDKGRSVREIAGRNGISEELAEQICRLYLTHPGVDADGIMEKIALNG